MIPREKSYGRVWVGTREDGDVAELLQEHLQSLVYKKPSFQPTMVTH